MQHSSRYLLLAGLAVLTSICLVWLVRSWRESPAPVAATASDPTADRLALWSELADRQDLDPQLIAMIGALKERIAELDESQQALIRELDGLRNENMRLARIDPGSSLPEDEEDADPLDQADADSRQQLPARERRRRGGVTEARLVEAGFTDFQARDIMGRMDELALERIALRYEAARDGTLNTPEYRRTVAELPDARQVLQREYGEDAYDRYLYASGRPNRIVVNDVYQGSAAAESGLQPGDVVLRMADQRVYRSDDLLSIASQGSAGATVPLLVRRDGVQVQLYVPRGPLGIRTRYGFENPAMP